MIPLRISWKRFEWKLWFVSCLGALWCGCVEFFILVVDARLSGVMCVPRKPLWKLLWNQMTPPRVAT